MQNNVKKNLLGYQTMLFLFWGQQVSLRVAIKYQLMADATVKMMQPKSICSW
jgi:hypothetical protein